MAGVDSKVRVITIENWFGALESKMALINENMLHFMFCLIFIMASGTYERTNERNGIKRRENYELKITLKSGNYTVAFSIRVNLTTSSKISNN